MGRFPKSMAEVCSYSKSVNNEEIPPQGKPYTKLGVAESGLREETKQSTKANG